MQPTNPWCVLCAVKNMKLLTIMAYMQTGRLGTKRMPLPVSGWSGLYATHQAFCNNALQGT